MSSKERLQVRHQGKTDKRWPTGRRLWRGTGLNHPMPLWRVFCDLPVR